MAPYLAHPARLLALCLAVVFACDPAPLPPSAVSTCLDLHQRETCTGSHCVVTPCRGDEVCQGDACIPWREGTYTVDFTATVSAVAPRRVDVNVLPGGFPREWVRALRFDFGDGGAGWGETISHTYDADGTYAIALEVRLWDFTRLRATRQVTVGESDASLSLTLNGIPVLLNGSAAARSDAGTADPSDDVEVPFHLLVPTHGFDVNVMWLDGATNDEVIAVNPSSVSLTADVPLGKGALAAGSELMEHVVFPQQATMRVNQGKWRVAPELAFPPGMVTLTLTGNTAEGVALPAQVLRFEVAELTPELDPFDREMVWLFRFDLDFFSTTASAVSTGGLVLHTQAGANGIADFTEELRAIGAQGDESGPDASDVTAGGRTGANAIYRRWVIDAVIRSCYRYFLIDPEGTPAENIQFRIFAEDDADAPDPATFDPAGTFSIMRFGGTFPSALGYSGFAPHNEGRVDNSTVDRGVATATLIGSLVSTPELTDAFVDIKPNTGTPVGEGPHDATILAEGFDPFEPSLSAEVRARYDSLWQAADFIGQAVAAVAAHEMGHAMGLVPNGPPPAGFFGGRPDISFMNAANTNSHHADYPGLNLMQAGGSLVSVLITTLTELDYPPGLDLEDLARIFSQENRLSPYSFAYLNRQLIYTRFDGAPPPAPRGCFAR